MGGVCGSKPQVAEVHPEAAPTLSSRNQPSSKGISPGRKVPSRSASEAAVSASSSNTAAASQQQSQQQQQNKQAQNQSQQQSQSRQQQQPAQSTAPSTAAPSDLRDLEAIEPDDAEPPLTPSRAEGAMLEAAEKLLLASPTIDLDLRDAAQSLAVETLASNLLDVFSDDALGATHKLEQRLMQPAHKGTVSVAAHLALKLARSRAVMAAVTAPLHLSVVIAINRLAHRLRPPQDDALGEDILLRKVAQLEALCNDKVLITWDLVLVDEACPDASGRVAREIISRYRPDLSATVRVIFLEEAIQSGHEFARVLVSPRNSVVGGAIQYGFYEAVHQPNQQALMATDHIVVFTSPDSAAHLGQLGLLVDAIVNQGRDCAKGTRREAASVVGRHTKGWGRTPRSKLFSYLWKRLLSPLNYIVDLRCNYKAFRADTLRTIVTTDLVEHKWAWDLELMLKTELLRQNSIARVPLAWIESEFEQPNGDSTPYLAMLQSVARLYKKYCFHNPTADKFAAFMGEMDETMWQRLTHNVPDMIADGDPNDFSFFTQPTLEELRQLLIDDEQAESELNLMTVNEIIQSAPLGPLDLRDEDLATAVASLALKIYSIPFGGDKLDALTEFEEELSKAMDAIPLSIHLAVKIAKSRALMDNVKEPLHITVLIPLFADHERLRSKEDHPLGENALLRKIKQLQDLCRTNPHTAVTWDVILVDAGCPHSSGQVALHILNRDYLGSSVRVLFLDNAVKQGHELAKHLKCAPGTRRGAALLYGYYEAVHSRCTDATRDKVTHVVVTTDCSLATHLGQTGLLLDALLNQGRDVVLGNRFAPTSLSSPLGFGEKPHTLLGLYLCRRLFMSLAALPDITCPYRACRGDLLEQVVDSDLAEHEAGAELALLLKCELLRPQSTASAAIGCIVDDGTSAPCVSLSAELEPCGAVLRSVARAYGKYVGVKTAVGEEFAMFLEPLADETWSALSVRVPASISAITNAGELAGDAFAAPKVADLENLLLLPAQTT